MIDPDSALRLLIIMFVPPAIVDGTPSNSRAGNRMVPSARPTNPPSIPVRSDITANKIAFHSKTSEGNANWDNVISIFFIL